jgi:hypothetical protein
MFNFRAALWALVVVGCAAAAGCAQSRRPIGGTVTVNGAPLDLGMITFVPMDTAGGQTSVGGKVTNGTYSLDATRGPFPGRYRVEIYWAKKTGRRVPNGDGGMQDETVEGLPTRFNKDTELTLDVTSRTKTADFNLTP